MGHGKSKLAVELTALRTARGLSQREVARRLGMHQTAICHYESGRSLPSVATLRRLAQLYGTERNTSELLLRLICMTGEAA